MSGTDLIQQLEAEYDQNTGFIGRLRYGTFDELGLTRVLAVLRQFEPTGNSLDRRLVALLWWMPWIIEWQFQRLTRESRAKEAAVVSRASEAIFKECERILGVP
jgi:hypothetical protein